MRASNKQLTILSEAEKAALYESPDFDDEQRLSFLKANSNIFIMMKKQTRST